MLIYECPVVPASVIEEGIFLNRITLEPLLNITCQGIYGSISGPCIQSQ